MNKLTKRKARIKNWKDGEEQWSNNTNKVEKETSRIRQKSIEKLCQCNLKKLNKWRELEKWRQRKGNTRKFKEKEDEKIEEKEHYTPINRQNKLRQKYNNFNSDNMKYTLNIYFQAFLMKEIVKSMLSKCPLFSMPNLFSFKMKFFSVNMALRIRR